MLILYLVLLDLNLLLNLNLPLARLGRTKIKFEEGISKVIYLDENFRILWKQSFKFVASHHSSW